MKQLSKKIAFITIGGMLAITACNNSPYPGYEKSEDGLYYKFYKQNKEGKKAVEGDVLKLSMVCKNSKDSTTFDSRKVAPGNFGFQYSSTTFGGLFLKAMSMLSAGDSVSFKIASDSVFHKNIPAEQVPAFIEKGTVLTFDFKVDTILTKEEVQKEQEKRKEEYKAMMELRKNEEAKILAKFLEENNIKVKPTESGLFFIEKIKGKGVNPKKGEIVKVMYTGKLVDGTIFDTSIETVAKEAGLFDPKRPYQPIEFPLGVGQVIKGWEEGIAMMKPGSKAQFIIPSSLGYGEQGGGPIPPYSTLVFDVELISFQPAK